MGEWLSASGPGSGSELNPAPSCVGAQPAALAPGPAGPRTRNPREEGVAWAWAARTVPGAIPGAAGLGAASDTIMAAGVGTGRVWAATHVHDDTLEML